MELKICWLKKTPLRTYYFFIWQSSISLFLLIVIHNFITARNIELQFYILLLLTLVQNHCKKSDKLHKRAIKLEFYSLCSCSWYWGISLSFLTSLSLLTPPSHKDMPGPVVLLHGGSQWACAHKSASLLPTDVPALSIYTLPSFFT